MTLQLIDIGNAPNDGTGDPNRTAFAKINANFTELYNLVLGGQSPGQDAPIWETIDYNSQQVINGRSWVVTSAENPWNIQMANNYPGLTKFEVRANDNRQGDPSYRERAEFSGSGFAVQSEGDAPTEVWVSYSMVVLATDTARWNTLFQAFALASNGNTITGPVAKLEQKEGTNTEVNIAGNTDNGVRAQIAAWTGTAFTANRQYNMVWRFVFRGDNGELDLWVNGTKVIGLIDRPIGFGLDTVTYLKYGIYRDILVNGAEETEPPYIVVFSPVTVAEGDNALLGKVITHDPMPYYEGIYPLGAISGQYLTAPTPTSPAGANIVAANWSMLAAAGSTAVNNPAGTLTLTGGGLSYGAAADQEILTTPGQTVLLEMDVEGEAVGIRVGTTRGDFQLLPLTTVNPGVNRQISFTATGSSAWIRLNKQATNTTVVKNISNGAGTPPPAPGPNEGVIDPTQWEMLTAAGSSAVNNPAGVLTLAGGGTSYGAAADQDVETVAGATYEITFSIDPGESVNLRVGTVKGGTDIRPATSYLFNQTHTVAFTAVGAVTWLRFNRQAAGPGVVRNISSLSRIN